MTRRPTPPQHRFRTFRTTASATPAAGLTAIDRKLQAGDRPTFEDGVRLFESPDLLTVGWLAHRARERR